MHRSLVERYCIGVILWDLLKSLRFCEDFDKKDKVLLKNRFIGDGAGYIFFCNHLNKQVVKGLVLVYPRVCWVCGVDSAYFFNKKGGQSDRQILFKNCCLIPWVLLYF